MRLRTLSMLLLVAAPLAACLSPLWTLRGNWIRLETPNFIVITDVGEEEARDLVRELALFRVAVQEITKIRVPREPVPLRVYVFARTSSFRHYRPPQRSIGGYFVRSPYGDYIALSGDDDLARPMRIVYHEYVHYLLRHHPTPLALWYHEGLAEIFSSFRVEEGWAQVGHPLGDRLKDLRRTHWARSERLFEIDESSEEYLDPLSAFHAQAWALAHYFMFGEARRREQLEDYIARMNQGLPHADAYALAFDVDEDALWSEVVAHVRAEEFRFGEISVDELAAPPQPKLRVLEESEAAYLLGDLMLRQGPGYIDDARSLLERALELDPNHAEANAAMVEIDDYQERHAEARAHQKRAFAAAPDSFRVRMISGDRHYNAYLRGLDAALDTSLSPPPGLEQELELARNHYAHAIHLNRRVSAAYVRYGQTFLFGSGSRRKGEVALVAARRIWPNDRDIAATLALLHLRADRRVDARRVLADVLRSDPDSDAVKRWIDELTANLLKLPASRH